jgi:hypothetical protein
LIKKDKTLLKNKKKQISTAAETDKRIKETTLSNIESLGGQNINRETLVHQDTDRTSLNSYETEQYTDQEIKYLLTSTDDAAITTTESKYLEVNDSGNTESVHDVSSDKEFAAGRVGMKYREGTIGAGLYEVSTLAEINGFLSLGQVRLLNENLCLFSCL